MNHCQSHMPYQMCNYDSNECIELYELHGRDSHSLSTGECIGHLD